MVFKWIQGQSQIQCFARNSLSLLSKSSARWRGGRSADSYIKAWHSPPTKEGSHLPKLDLGITNPAPAAATDTNPLSSTNSPHSLKTTYWKKQTSLLGISRNLPSAALKMDVWSAAVKNVNLNEWLIVGDQSVLGRVTICQQGKREQRNFSKLPTAWKLLTFWGEVQRGEF